jgi:hypothetical protein
MGEAVNAMTDNDRTENPHKNKQPSSAGSVGSSGGSEPLEEDAAHYLGIEFGLYVQFVRKSGRNNLISAPYPRKNLAYNDLTPVFFSIATQAPAIIGLQSGFL